MAMYYPLFHRNVASTELINKLWKRQWVWEIFESETHYICKIQINRKKSEMITKHEYCSCLTICLNQWNLSQVKAETCLFFQWIYEAMSRNLSWKSFSYSVQASGSVRQILYAYVPCRHSAVKMWIIPSFWKSFSFGLKKKLKFVVCNMYFHGLRTSEMESQ